MKKPMRVRKYLLGSLSCIILGGICLTIGLMSNGSIEKLEISQKNYSWWPLKNVSMGIKATQKDSQAHFTYAQNLDSISAVKASISNGSIKIVKGDKNNVEVKNATAENLKITSDNNTLRIIGNANQTLHLGISWFNNLYNGDITITLVDKLYDSIQLENNFGDIEVNDLKTKSIYADLNLGQISLNNTYSENTKIDQDYGDIMMSGTFLNKSEIDNNLGETSISIIGKESDYKYDLECNIGNILINNQNIGNDTNNILGITNNLIEIDNSFGDIKLNFSEK